MFAPHGDAGPVIRPDGIHERLLCRGRRLMLVELFFPWQARSKPHRHTQEQVGFVRSGRLEVYIGRQSQILRPGDSYCVPPGERHYVVALEPDSVLVDCLGPGPEGAGPES